MNKALIDNGGSAFPGQGSAVAIPADMVGRAHEIKVKNDGMTLRDYFAAKALQGELASQHDGYEWNDSKKLAAFCYSVADSMIEERQS